MSKTILHISGPPASGKTALANALATRRPANRSTLVRFDLPNENGTPPLRIARSFDTFANSLRYCVNPDLVFEQVSDALRSIEAPFPDDLLLVETNAEPCFRHAYPYDIKIFVFSPPDSMDAIFRTPSETVGAIERAMHDTAEFAAEMFGLERSPFDSAALPSIHSDDRRVTATQTTEEFLDSDVGTEIASRLHLRPRYHAVIDSDVILLNTPADRDAAIAAECAEKIETLLDPLRQRLDRDSWFAACDLHDPQNTQTRRALDHIDSLLMTAETTTP